MNFDLFLGSFEVNKVEKSCKNRLGGQFGSQKAFWRPLGAHWAAFGDFRNRPE